jgi:hypothetical protein
MIAIFLTDWIPSINLFSFRVGFLGVAAFFNIGVDLTEAFFVASFFPLEDDFPTTFALAGLVVLTAFLIIFLAGFAAVFFTIIFFFTVFFFFVAMLTFQ